MKRLQNDFNLNDFVYANIFFQHLSKVMITSDDCQLMMEVDRQTTNLTLEPSAW